MGDVMFYKVDRICAIGNPSRIDRYFCLFMFGRNSQNMKGFVIFSVKLFRNITGHAFYCTYSNAKFDYSAYLSKISIVKNVALFCYFCSFFKNKT